MPTTTPAPASAPLPYGEPITLAKAIKVAEAAVAEAKANNWSMVIAIVDSTGHLVVLNKMDSASYASVQIAQEKAQTSVEFRRSTALLEAALASGGVQLRLLAMRNVMPCEGGLPLIADGKIVGAIGVSGMTSPQDVQVAEAGVRAF